jgi:hypothetical protein
MTSALLRDEQLIHATADYDSLYDLLLHNKPRGIGHTMIYVFTNRIAAYIKCGPSKYLYLHAGPLLGWKRLTGERGNPWRVAWMSVPAPLRVLPSHKVEDLLCEYRDFLHPELMP